MKRLRGLDTLRPFDRLRTGRLSTGKFEIAGAFQIHSVTVYDCCFSGLDTLRQAQHRLIPLRFALWNSLGHRGEYSFAALFEIHSDTVIKIVSLRFSKFTRTGGGPYFDFTCGW